jgi:hypothetical protein
MNAERVKMWTTIAAITVIGIGVKIINKKRKRRMWCRPWLLRRNQGKDVLNMLNDELRVEDIGAYRNFLRVTAQQFEYLLNEIENDISKEDTVMRGCIPARSK